MKNIRLRLSYSSAHKRSRNALFLSKVVSRAEKLVPRAKSLYFFEKNIYNFGVGGVIRYI